MDRIKERIESWQEGMSKDITFIVTKDCQLACKYCYLVGKNTKERMTFEVAKQAIDYIFDHEEDFPEESVTWDFIGGEPFLEVDLIDKICDYIKIEMFRRNHRWFNSYRFSFSTNGINYSTEKVQRFVKKNQSHLSIVITIDGTKRKHDLNSIWKAKDMERGIMPKLAEEKGSYDDVVKNIPLWLSQFTNDGTKVTISSADIKYIKESVLHLYSLGIHNVSINCVFENVWHDGDDKLSEDQLKQLADSIIDGGWYKDYACSFFDENIGKPMDSKLDNNNWCGAGKMLSIDAAGNFYPCTRFAGYSLRSKKPIIIGQLYKLDHAPICRHCDAYQCRRCVWLNRKTTLEVNTPSHEQCVVAHLERNASRMLLRNIRKHGQFLPQQEDIKETDYLDPFDKKEEWL